MNGTILSQAPQLYQQFPQQYLNHNKFLKQPPQAPQVICDQQTEQQYTEQLTKYIFKQNSLQLPALAMEYPISSSLTNKRYIRFLVQLMRGLTLASYLKSLPFAEPQKNVLLPPTKKKFTLLLDLDETLIHSEMQQFSAYCQTLQINGINLYYMYRPNIQQFLQEVSKYFEIIIFTAAQVEYAKVFCQSLTGIDYILSREHVRQHSSGYLIKDLSVIQQSRNLENIIIVDNLISCFANNLNNGIPCIEFNGEIEDQELLALGKFLQEIAHQSLKNQCSLINSLAMKNWIPQSIPKEWKQLMMIA